MPFVKIAPKARYVRDHGATQITIGVYLGEGKGKEGIGVKHFTFRLPMAIVKESGIPYVDHKLYLNIHEGTGEDAGFLMLVHDPVTGYTATQSKTKLGGAHSGCSLNIAMVKFSYYTPNETPIPATPVDHAIQDGGILIECPEWLRPDIAKMTADGLMPPAQEPPPPPEPEPKPEPKRYPLARKERRVIASRVAHALAKH